MTHGEELKAHIEARFQQICAAHPEMHMEQRANGGLSLHNSLGKELVLWVQEQAHFIDAGGHQIPGGRFDWQKFDLTETNGAAMARDVGAKALTRTTRADVDSLIKWIPIG